MNYNYIKYKLFVIVIGCFSFVSGTSAAFFCRWNLTIQHFAPCKFKKLACVSKTRLIAKNDYFKTCFFHSVSSLAVTCLDVSELSISHISSRVKSRRKPLWINLETIIEKELAKNKLIFKAKTAKITDLSKERKA